LKIDIALFLLMKGLGIGDWKNRQPGASLQRPSAIMIALPAESIGRQTMLRNEAHKPVLLGGNIATENTEIGEKDERAKETIGATIEC
jgi:hypothetical protein